MKNVEKKDKSIFPELKEVTKELNFIERIFFKEKFIKIYKNGIKKGFNWEENR